jgi:hypothetical protein
VLWKLLRMLGWSWKPWAVGWRGNSLPQRGHTSLPGRM